MNLSSEILSFFIRQEMGNTSTCNLRNKMCITIINDYVQLPLLSGKNFLAAPYCLPGTTQLGEMRYGFHGNCLFLIIFALAVILINLNMNCKSNLSKEILIFFLRQEIIAPAMSLTISRNKICVIIKQYYMQLPLGQNRNNFAGKMCYRFHPNCLFVIILTLTIKLLNLKVNHKRDLFLEMRKGTLQRSL